MSITGPCIGKLNRGTAVNLLNRIQKILKSKFLKKLSLNLFTTGANLGLINQMRIEDQNTLLDVVYDMGTEKSNIGAKSAELY